MEAEGITTNRAQPSAVVSNATSQQIVRLRMAALRSILSSPAPTYVRSAQRLLQLAFRPPLQQISARLLQWWSPLSLVEATALAGLADDHGIPPVMGSDRVWARLWYDTTTDPAIITAMVAASAAAVGDPSAAAEAAVEARAELVAHHPALGHYDRQGLFTLVFGDPSYSDQTQMLRIRWASYLQHLMAGHLC
jgi:hypothetical protein